MQYRRFLFYNILGAACWTVGIALAGYYFGSMTVVKENMSLLIMGVILLSVGTLCYILCTILKSWWDRRKAAG